MSRELLVYSVLMVSMGLLCSCTHKSTEPAEEDLIAVIKTSMGTIEVDLYEDKMPNTVGNFVRLVDDGFYNGLVFHRVVDDFVIQSGGFEADGALRSSPYGAIDLEIHPDAKHVDGAMAMARTTDPNSATSEFYICDGPQTHLDDEYAVFGVVDIGIDIVRGIAEIPTVEKYGHSNWPETDVTVESISIKP